MTYEEVLSASGRLDPVDELRSHDVYFMPRDETKRERVTRRIAMEVSGRSRSFKGAPCTQNGAQRVTHIQPKSPLDAPTSNPTSLPHTAPRESFLIEIGRAPPTAKTSGDGMQCSDSPEKNLKNWLHRVALSRWSRFDSLRGTETPDRCSADARVQLPHSPLSLALCVRRVQGTSGERLTAEPAESSWDHAAMHPLAL